MGVNLPDQTETDSLKQVLTKQLSPSDKINTLFILSQAYLDASELKSALENNTNLNEYISKHGTRADSAKCSRLTGLIYLKMAWYDKALENFMKAHQLFGELRDTSNQARSLMNIGIVHDYLGNKPMSLSYYNKALDLYKRTNNESGIANCELNIAILLSKQKQFAKACEYLISAAGIYEKTGNTSNLAAAYINLGLTYKKLGNYSLAIDYLNRAYEISVKYDITFYICNFHLNMGEIMLDLHQREKAYEHLSKAVILSKKLENKEFEVRAYEFLSDYSAAKGNYQLAYTYLNKSKQINDSILNAETTEKVNQIQYHYEIAKREADNNKLVRQNLNKELQLSKKNLFLFILSIIIVFIGVLVVILVNQNRIKRRANRQLEAQNDLIESQRDELIKLNASKDKFLSILAHDIRNPLSSIFGISELLVSDYHKLTEKEKMVFTQDIHTLSENLFEIINTLLTWSTSQSGMISYRPTTFKFNELCNKSISALQTVAKQKDIKLVNRADDSLLVIADENMIYSVLQNLLNNAIKFSFPGTDICVETRHTDGFASVSVTDSGIGLTPESQAKLFLYDQHFMSKGTAGEVGTGLGLILCKDFVEKNGGTIRVKSEVSKGSTFVFTIPIASS
jgi:signal transduction histidine kinase